MRNSSGQNISPYGIHKNIYEIFVDYYGESNVDFQQDEVDGIVDVIVHFPEVTVSNERGNSVKIQDLFAKVTIDDGGYMSGTFRLRRTSFPLSQVYADYCHSHLCGISFDWDTPCLGTGPIKSTIDSLQKAADLDKWRLFCYELDMYVKTESIQGVPYKYLEKISTKESCRKVPEYRRMGDGVFVDNRISINLNDFNCYIIDYVPQKNTLKDFVGWFLCNNILPFRVLNNYYTIATSFFSFRLLLSNSFIYWVNHVNSSDGHLLYKELQDARYLLNVYIENGEAYFGRNSRDGNYHDYSKREFLERYQDKEVFVFKGTLLHYKFTDDMEGGLPSASYTLFSTLFTSFILYKILSFLNYGILQYSSECSETSFSEYSVDPETFVL